MRPPTNPYDRREWATRLSVDLVNRTRQRPSYPGGPRDPDADWTAEELRVATEIRTALLTKYASPNPENQP